MGGADNQKLEALIEEARASGGSERANYQLFVLGLCEVLDLPRPVMAREENEFNDYGFERRIAFKHPDGSTTPGWIDCYRRGSFILEAKQSAKRQARKADPSKCQMSLLSEDAGMRKAGHARRGSRGWDQVLLEARKQAENYARALPVEHGYPPFLLIVDVGNVIEIFADFSGQGKNYAHFPDRQSFRLQLDDLREADVQARLRAIWTDPLSLDPTRISAEVTRDIADRLARIAKRLEGRHDAKDVAEFLMRCLFTMFAEDVGLIPEKGFHKLLGQMKDTPKNFPMAMESLWKVMDEGGYAPHLNATLKRFNGALFKARRALPLDGDDINELFIAAGRDWSKVEPAIFGTLLERALDPRERSKLGAHYTPRAYVERLVVPTIIEPLKADWELVQNRVKELQDANDRAGALAAVKAFHHQLCTTRVLDPACGTGNFLYVSLELMKRLEGEVLEALDDLGDDQARFAMEGETVNPRQFYGLELNERAVPIADLVLWIGYLKWQLRTGGLASISEPVLHAYGTIRHQDAVIAYDRQELLRDPSGKPLSRWDGVTKKLHPITGEEVPDPDATMPLYKYVNPRRAPWPEVEFIVGNPPFIGNKRMISRLGEGYVETLRSAWNDVPESVDFVMYWWHRAAGLVREGKARAAGLVTTNSISQTYNRRVVAKALSSSPTISITFSVPDHIWSDDADAAAVRVAMSVVTAGDADGLCMEIVRDGSLGESDRSETVSLSRGKIGPFLRIGADLNSAGNLFANATLAHQGVTPGNLGFRLNDEQAIRWGSERVVRDYIIGSDLTDRRRPRKIIDFHGLSRSDAETQFPALFQVILDEVKPERDENRRESYKENFWLFVEPRNQMRQALLGASRMIVTCRTSRQRVFQFEPIETLCDAKVIVIANSYPDLLSCLSSRPHLMWAGEWAKLGKGNDNNYNHSECFNFFPFPLSIDPTLKPSDPLFAQQERLRDLGERLDVFRKQRLAEHGFLTMTGLYNALERLRELDNGIGAPLTAAEHDVHQAGLISVLKEIHDDIDRAVFAAYGWEDLIPRLVGKPGATLPSPHKTPDQEAAEEELLSRLVALNLERAAEEKRGLVALAAARLPDPETGRESPETGRRARRRARHRSARNLRAAEMAEGRA